ncbi:MAG: hypothetical protein ABJA02_03210 [Acidobacteriota bacterium]
MAALILAFAFGCSVAEPTANAKTNLPANANSSANPAAPASEAAPKGPTITIDKGGPADTVRAFYQLLRENKFRDAIFLTNLRPAIEGLTATELADFSLDFAALAGEVPAQIEINGEIISGDNATVTANFPADEDGKKETQQIKLKKNGDVWEILTVDEAAEARIKKEGKSYFYNLRIETHEDEAKKMLERIAKAEIAYSMQNGGAVAEIDILVGAGLLPEDVKTSVSTGYNYILTILPNKTRYIANATPAEYGKSGKLSFLLETDDKGYSHVTSKEIGGKPMKK